MADDACGAETAVLSQVTKLWTLVADTADHYSKDPSKPKCGRGNSEDCLAQGGGCCTDLHSLFIALARARGIPSRIWFGYRLQAKNDGKDADPGLSLLGRVLRPELRLDPDGHRGRRLGRPGVAGPVDHHPRRAPHRDRRRPQLRPQPEAGRPEGQQRRRSDMRKSTGSRCPLLPDKDGTPSPLVRNVFFTERKGGKKADPANRTDRICSHLTESP